MKKIILDPNPVLRKETNEVLEMNGLTKKEVGELKKILAAGENAAGLAATQIGVSKKFFGVKKTDGKIEVYFNPKLLKTWGKRNYLKMTGQDGKEEDFLEGCLSFPDYFGTVKRFLKIEVEWQEWDGKKFVSKSKELEGFEAIVWQHESDHLEGILFVDYIKNEGGKFYKWNGTKMVEADIKEIFKNE